MAFRYARTVGLFDANAEHWTLKSAKNSVEHLEWVLTSKLAEGSQHFGSVEIDNSSSPHKWVNMYVGDSVAVLFVKNARNYSLKNYP